MASQPRKPKTRSRRKAAPTQSPAPPAEELASAVAVLSGEAEAADESVATEPAPTSLEGRAEAVALALAELADEREPVPANELHDDEGRIRSVQDLLSRPDGEVELLLFRVGTELFAFDLSAAEEAVELEAVHAVPDMPHAMLGVFDLRGRLVPVYSPAGALRVPSATAAGVLLLMRAGARRVGIVVDDVQDVVMLGRAMLRPPPSGEGDGLVVGVAFFGDELVTILDAQALVATCALPAPVEAA